jgi:hypothetical protein
MTAPLRYEFADGLVASAMEVDDAAAVSALGLDPPMPTVTVVGGAGGLDETSLENLRSVFLTGIVPPLEELAALAALLGDVFGQSHTRDS